MRKRITIKIDEDLITHGGKTREIVIREPSYREYLELGDPYTVAGSKEGQMFAVENPDVIKAYIELCVVEPKDTALLEQCSARVAREVKQTVLGFFQPAGEAGAASETSPTTSSSAASGSAPTTPAN